MAGTLFVVATPIGHLDDISVRALRVLREVSLIAAEDTRRTGNLLRHFGIATRLVSLHAHNEHSRAGTLLHTLTEGGSVALVSDAGTPGISDPGAELVRLSRAAGIRVEAVPGPSAVAAAVSIAGLHDGGFAFLGFPPVRSKDRTKWFSTAARLHADVAVVFFEAPHRLGRTLEDLSFLGEQPITVCRELTKIHEETVQGTPTDLAARFRNPQGEFTIIIPAAEVAEDQKVTVDEADVIKEFGQITNIGLASKRAVAREVGKKFGLTTRQVYEIARQSTK